MKDMGLEVAYSNSSDMPDIKRKGNEIRSI
jgi:hypothetical protein